MNRSNDLKRNVIVSFLWRFAEQVGAQGVAFIVSLILARLLAPEVYGTIALVTVFINILNVFIDSGMGNALIQKKDADDLDFSSVFYFNVGMCVSLYFLMFIMAPIISRFYHDYTLTPVIRVLSLTLIISGVKNIQHAYVSRTMQFKRFFFSTIGGTIGAALIGIFLAYRGYGIWALVAQQLFNATMDTIILWITVKWRPKRVFSWVRLKNLLSYGWKLLVSSLLDTIYNNIRQLVIGRMYSSADLAFYNRGRDMPHLLINNVNSSINSVLFPTMSKAQDDRLRLREMTRRSTKISTYIMAPLLMGMAFCADPIVRLLFTDKWIECVPFMRIFCIIFMFYPIHTANLNAIKAMGRSDIFLKLENLKKIIGLIILSISMWFGVLAMAYSLLISTVTGMIINAWPNRKLLGYTYSDQMKDIIPTVLLALFMGFCVLPIQLLHLSNLFTLILQILLGSMVYIIGSKLLKLDSFEYLLSTIKSMMKKTA